MADLTTAFAVPLATAQLPDCDSLNEELRKVFLAHEAEGERFANPSPFVYRNRTLFESRFDLFDWPQPCIAKLREFCLANVYGVIRELNGYDNDTLQKLHIQCESWFHITRRGGFFGAHNHPLHSWSGVYCVKHDGDDPDSTSGKLTFINPMMSAGMYTDMAIAKTKRPFGFAPIKLRLKPGQLVLFPSWLLHEVLPYEGDSERITVAFNARFRYQGENVDEILRR